MLRDLAMASMMGGDLVEAYVLKNACKEKLRRMEAAATAADDKTSKQGRLAEKKVSGRGRRLLGLLKKKVHPKAAASSSPPESGAEEAASSS